MSDVRATMPLGLSHQQAFRRLKKEGPNELPREKKRRWIFQILEVLREPMFVLLAVACTIYFVLGSTYEAFVLSGALLGVVFISVVQERRAQNALEALQSLTSPRARVIRERSEHRIPAEEIVRGDILHLVEGDRVPADAMLLQSMHLRVDESMLTGESSAVSKHVSERKKVGAKNCGKMGRERSDCVYAGSLIVSGDGYALVFATGRHTEMGKIGLSLVSISTEHSVLQKQIKHLVGLMAVIGVGTSSLLFLLFGLRDADWLSGALAAVSIAMSLLPEEFPIVLTLFLSIGAWRLSRQKVLTRHLPAIESLGAATVLCVDKTGTLTQNEMQLSAAWRPQNPALNKMTALALERPWRHLVALGAWASPPRAHDPMERAFISFYRQLQKQSYAAACTKTWTAKDGWVLEEVFPITNERLAVIHVWHHTRSGRRRIAAKGAPEAVIRLCALSPSAADEVSRAVEGFARKGRRVLAIAKGVDSGEKWNAPERMQFHFSGVVAFYDPLRPLVPESVADCQRAGLRVIMITGDFPDTAVAIAEDAGIANANQTVTGEQIEKCTEDELRHVGVHAAVFARARPHHKLHLVRALQANNHVVAMTGDGVNDAPALRAAEIGVAMGGRGSDVAREASDIVVTDDNFTSIVDAIRTGRTIYDNLQKSMCYLVAVHVLIAGVAIWPVLFGGPMILFPLHIVFLEMVIDPSCSIAFEAEAAERDVMSRPPRTKDQSLFPSRLLTMSLLQGASACLVCIFVFELGRWAGLEEGAKRALVFTTLLSGNLMLILVNLSWSRGAASILRGTNRPALLLYFGATLFLFFALTSKTLRGLFLFDELPFVYSLSAFIGGGVSVLWFEWLKKRRHVIRHG